jgi:Rad3-related DNA helicase
LPQASNGAQPTGHVARLVDLLAAHPDGLTGAQVRSSSAFSGVPAPRLAALIGTALALGHVTETTGRLHAVNAAASAAEPADAEPLTTALRAVVLDVESIVKTTSKEPFTEKRIYQIGAVRAGTDSAWIGAEPAFTRWLELPDDTWVILSEGAWAEQQASAVAPADALMALLAYCDSADVLVTYNGTEADFPLLNESFAREGLPPLAGRYVDAYYLALALWPSAPSHRLAELAAHVGVRIDDLRWHDATADSEMLSRLLTVGASALMSWPAERRDLIASVCAHSPAWHLMRDLAGSGGGTASAHSAAQAAAILETGLVATVRRPAAGIPAPGMGRLTVADHLRGSDGNVDPIALARVVHDTDAARRPAQDEMTTRLHAWAQAGTSALIEAPTGTGKSYAILAAAMQWLHADTRRRVIVATFTKQLQAQLADDVAALDVAVPGLIEASDVVKGAANRLSLRAVVAALADASSPPARSARPGNRNRFLSDPKFRELLAYLTLRLLAANDVQASWAAHSTDPVDLPAMFSGAYIGKVVSLWLNSLSQASNGEYDARAPQALAAHTDLVAEALGNHRLILANHALLLAHLDDLAALGPDTLLVVDEAHQLEDAATSALTTTLDYQAVEDLLAELVDWIRDNTRGRGTEGGSVVDAVRNLGFLLDHEQLPKAAGQAFDARSGGGPGLRIGSRAVTLASPYSGDSGIRQVGHLSTLLLRLSGQCEALVGALGTFLTAHGTTLDYFARERLRALIARVAGVAAAATTIVADINAIIVALPGPRSAAGPVPSGSSGGASPASTASADLDGGTDSDATDAVGAEEGIDDEPNGDDLPDDGDDLADDVDTDGPQDTDDGATGAVRAVPDESLPLGSLPPGTTNRVVYAEETEVLRGGLRTYPFELSTAPIELPEDATWRQFTATFARTYYVSATLRVAGEWTFIRQRLGLGTAVDQIAFDTPFKLGTQAELVCLSDFPSWAEQSEGATRTVAHQLAGYSAEMVRAAADTDPEGPDPETVEQALSDTTRGGFDGGAMVLTTARSTAGGIASHLLRELRARDDDTNVISALVRGNNRAFREFTEPEYGGGFLVGTRGLWQGVDVSDEQRLRLVWINKLPFAPFAAPIIEARRAVVVARASSAGAEDPDAIATERFYLPLAALQLRQAVGRLVRSERHRGVIIISDRKLAGQTALRRSYRRTFLGSLDQDLLRDDPDTGEAAGGNVVTMAEGWARIWQFFARHGLLDQARADELCAPDALDEHTLLPQTRRIRQLAMTPDDVAKYTVAGALESEVLDRAAQIGGLLRLSDSPATLKESQKRIIGAVATGQDVLGLLPTGFGKSFCFQLPALVLPGVTLVISPLVALMTDQALELNRSVGGAVRALVAPLRESSSRAGKTEVADQLLGRADHGIRIVYVSPERLCQRRFQQVVRDAVAAGRINRIALDEAHTFVQWADFRPSFSRVERFLGELRRDHGLMVTALTATANHTVHAGLREDVFGLPGTWPAAGSPEAAAEPLVTVLENPIRPELAVFRRSIGAANPALVAGLAEEVLDGVADHAIFYCLTVKEVVALHAQLVDYLGDGGRVRVRRFHGRLTEAEKSAVLTEFREAPKRGEEDYVPLIVVATSAFGLGINRDDIRTVFAVSAPTDLSALYQQLGRAGRDVAGPSTTGADPDAPEPPNGSPGEAGAVVAVPNVGLALMTNRALRTVQFMTNNDLHPGLLTRMAQHILAAGTVLDAGTVADNLIGEDLSAGRLTPDEARKIRTAEEYTAGVVRAFTALADLGAVDDLGDFPPLAVVKASELPPPVERPEPGSADDILERVVVTVLALPARSTPGRLGRSRLDVVALHDHLARSVQGYRAVFTDPAGTWQVLADLHDLGRLDVSAAPSRTLVTGIVVHSSAVPAGFTAAVSGKAARAAVEVGHLISFFADTNVCANRKFADYFGVPDLPPGCCTTAENRCSACWDFTDTWPAGQTKPVVARRLQTPRPRPAGARIDSAHRQRRLDDHVFKLVHHVFRGVHPLDLVRVLRGVDYRWDPRARRRRYLPTALTTSRFFGSKPGVAEADVRASLDRLEADGRVVREGVLYRETGNVRRAAARAAAGAP